MPHSLKPHIFPAGMPRDCDGSIHANGQPLDLLSTLDAGFVSYECEGEHELTVRLPEAMDQVIIHPFRLQQQARMEDGCLYLSL